MPRSDFFTLLIGCFNRLFSFIRKARSCMIVHMHCLCVIWGWLLSFEKPVHPRKGMPFFVNRLKSRKIITEPESRLYNTDLTSLTGIQVAIRWICSSDDSDIMMIQTHFGTLTLLGRLSKKETRMDHIHYLALQHTHITLQYREHLLISRSCPELNLHRGHSEMHQLIIINFLYLPLQIFFWKSYKLEHSTVQAGKIFTHTNIKGLNTLYTKSISWKYN